MSLDIYNSEQIKAWDSFTIAHEPVSSINLMERAATLCTKQILATNLFKSVSVFCGVGNNGGDGLVIARLLHQRGIKVEVFIVEFSSTPSHDFIINRGKLPTEIAVTSINSKSSTFAKATVDKKKIKLKSDLIIDAIFGSGLNKEIDGWIAEIVKQINASEIRIVSVDLPSGLFVSDNRKNSLKNIVCADQTITFQSPKMAFFYAEYSGFVGDFRVIDIGLSKDFKQKAFANYITRNDIQLKERSTFSHKGKQGFLTIVAGFDHYYGAAVLASRAALRSGCGYVATHCNENAVSILLQSIPECLFVPEINSGFPGKTTAIAIGPGLGTSHQAGQLLEKALRSCQPIVIDADALNLLSSHHELMLHLPADSILTPHPGELERLIGHYDHPEEVLEKQIEFSKKHKVFILQKGAYSKLTTPDGEIFINSSGNAGMATAGTGDVLTGIIGSFLAQEYSPKDAAINGMYIHGSAADLVKRQHGERGMIASDLIEALPQALNLF